MNLVDYFYHVTPTENVDSILRNGLIPSTPSDFDDAPGVYLFYSVDDAANALMNWMGDRDIFEDIYDFTLLWVDARGIHEIDELNAAPYEIIVTHPIDPRFIGIEHLEF